MAGTHSILVFMKRPRNCLIIVTLHVVVLLIMLTYRTTNELFSKSAPVTSSVSHIFKAGHNEKDVYNNGSPIGYDIHLEGNTDVKHVHNIDHSITTVAIGLALTSAGVYNITEENLRYKFPFFRSLLPSFCKTSTQGYSYQFYVAYDASDPFFNKATSFQWFTNVFYTFRREICGYVTDMQLHLIQCTHSQKPAWAQNDAMMEAYLDHIDYYYRVNDDTMLKSPGWTETLITTLQKFDPPNVGVVGPTHASGKINILTYDFVHRSHIDIFGFYYPRMFTDWFADDWITSVYEPTRCTKILQVKVLHTMLLGTRYNKQMTNAQYLKFQIDHDKAQLFRYLQRHPSFSNRTIRFIPNKDPTKVIAMALPNTDINHVHGAIRNIYLTQLYAPEWTLYIYIDNNGISPRILNKLKLSGDVKFVYVSQEIPLCLYPYTIADNSTVKYFIKRDVLARLTERDCEIMRDWVTNDESFFCARDHPLLHNASLIPGLFGAKSTDLLSALGTQSIQDSIVDFVKSQSLIDPDIKDDAYHINDCGLEFSYLNTYVWSRIKSKLICYDDIHCDNQPLLGKTKEFRTSREEFEFVGEQFGAFEYPIDLNASAIFHTFEKTC